MSMDKPNGAEKRRLYMAAFCIALVIDLGISFFKNEPYRPTLIGLAIMIASVLYFLYSYIRDR
ncbi:MAG: hypothetical protein ACKVKG_14230 [Alphaproteobacteria bacterium]|jgi:hypothetical protein